MADDGPIHPDPYPLHKGGPIASDQACALSDDELLALSRLSPEEVRQFEADLPAALNSC